MKEKLGWYLITKKFRGGEHRFALKLTKKIVNKFQNIKIIGKPPGTVVETGLNWDELFEYIGEHTDGGHADGYNLTAKFCKTKPKADYTLRLVKRTEERLVLR